MLKLPEDSIVILAGFKGPINTLCTLLSIAVSYVSIINDIPCVSRGMRGGFHVN